MKKQCSKCRELKYTSYFSKGTNKDGLQAYCIECVSGYDSIRYNKNKEKIKADVKKYRDNNRGKINRYQKKRCKEDIEFKVRGNICVALVCHIRRDYKKSKYSDYSSKDLRKHLEGLWTDGMSWNNYGNGVNRWNIDHIMPKSMFNFVNEDGSVDFKEVVKANSLDNLQPMWSLDNISKGKSL